MSADVVCIGPYRRAKAERAAPNVQQEKTVSELLREIAASLGIRDRFDLSIKPRNTAEEGGPKHGA